MISRNNCRLLTNERSDSEYNAYVSKLNEHALIFQQLPFLQQRYLRDVSIPILLFVVLHVLLLLTLDRVNEFLIKNSHDTELVPFHVWMLFLFLKRQMTLRDFVRGNNQIGEESRLCQRR